MPMPRTRNPGGGRRIIRCAGIHMAPHGSQAADTTPQCPKHGAMKPSTKGKGWYCPHKLADGS